MCECPLLDSLRLVAATTVPHYYGYRIPLELVEFNSTQICC